MKKLIFIIAALALIASPAMSADWGFYGSARIQTVYTDDDVGSGGLNPNALGAGYPVPTPVGTDDDDKGIDWDLMNFTSRIGARVKGDVIDGRMEIRPDSGGSWRLIWGEWKINSGLRLRVGKQWTPVTYFYSGQQVNDAGMAGPDGAGGVTLFRQPMIKLVIGEGQNLQIALVDGDAASPTGGDVDIFLPVLQARYHFAGDAFFFDVGGAYWSYEVEGAGTSVSPDDSLTAYMGAIGGGFNFGPAYIKANAWMGQNVSDLSMFTNGLGYDAVAVVDAGGNFDDTDSWGVLGVVGFRFTDQMAVEGGIGYEEHDMDFTGSDEDETLAYYAHLNYTAAPGVSIIPELGYIDYKDDMFGVDSGDRLYFNVKWQIDF